MPLKERKRICDYIAKVTSERGKPPPVREINQVLGNNNNGYFYNSFGSIAEACREAGIIATKDPIEKSQPAATVGIRQVEFLSNSNDAGPTTNMKDDQEEEKHRHLKCGSCE